MRILQEDSLAFVIDIQEKLFPYIHDHNILARNCQILLSGLLVLEIPMLVTEQYPKGLGPTIELIKDHLPEYKPIEKVAFSCCGSQPFCDTLKATGKKNVIVFGIEAHVCVLQTVIDLIEMDYRPVLITDCVSSRKQSDRDIALRRMRQEGAILTSYESVLFELSRIAGTEKFKQVSKLIK